MFNLKTIPQNIKAALSDEDFKIYAKAGDEIELLIMDVIGADFMGEGIGAAQVAEFLGDNKDKPVNVRLNSPGGLAFDGVAIYSALSAHPQQVTATVEGLAFSAASIVAMGADTVRMFEASKFGIHRSMGVAVGNAKAARGLAEWLDQLDDTMVEIYQAKTGATKDQIGEWMDGTVDGTLFSAAEAVEAGFADELIPLKKKPAADKMAAHSRYAAELRQKRLRARLTR